MLERVMSGGSIQTNCISVKPLGYVPNLKRGKGDSLEADYLGTGGV